MTSLDISRSSAESTILDEDFSRYTSTFIQKIPKFGIRELDGWQTFDSASCSKRANALVRKHLTGDLYFGTLSRWYPSYAILDVDDLKCSLLLDNIREAFHLSGELGSIAYETSPGSYHILFRQQYGGKPATIKCLYDRLGPYVKQLSSKMAKKKEVGGIELYPQENRLIRAPFHPDYKYFCRNLTSLGSRLNAFDELAVLDLKSFDAEQRYLARESGKNTTRTVNKPTKGVMKEGADLYELGMQQSSESRFFAQHKVAMWLWRLNFTPEQAKDELFRWVCDMTNGFSKDAKAINHGDYRTEQQVRREHENLVDHIWNTFERYDIYPATTHNGYYGWFTKADLVMAVKHSGGNIPRFKFLAQMLAYFTAHRRLRLNVHCGKLQEWTARDATIQGWAGLATPQERNNCSSHYLKHLKGLEEAGILSRDHRYLASEFSKVIELNIKPTLAHFDDSSVFTDGLGQALTFDESLDEMGRKETYELLTANGIRKQYAYSFVENRCLVR